MRRRRPSSSEGRRQLRKDVEYEVEFFGKPGQHWVLQSKLEAAGWEKMLKFEDDATAMLNMTTR
jgi:hypothetical protein